MLDKGKEVDIYLFSGTGNTLLIAQTLANFLKTNGFKVNLKAMEKSDASQINLSRTLGLAFPVAEQGTFPLVWDFIKGLPSPGKLGIRDMEVFMVDT
ncbi:MAG: flavodoxin family protein, partial [Spirochaetaceae bacterium]|nr:flavodoxin family protein [Spirochaetaceae bacterium]